MSGRQPGAVVFDLGNVLIRWDPLPALTAGLGEDEAARFLAAEDFDFSAWNARADAGERWDDLETEVGSTHPHWHRQAAAYRPNFGLSLVGPIEENVALLRELHDAGVPLLALTNWSAELFPVARERFDFLALFDDIVVSGEVGLAKPDPAVFALLGERVGRPLRECVFVDDSPRNVAAAAEAGLDAIRYDGAPLRPALEARGLLR